MDPLDPLTEIIQSGEAFFPFIALERILWVMMGFFLLGAISSSITKGMKQNDWFGNKSFLSGIRSSKSKDKLPSNISNDDK